MQYAAIKGEDHPMIANAPALPHGCEQLWADFLHLHRRRGNNGFGPSLITDMELDAFQRVHRVALPWWQIKAIFGADDAFRAQHAQRQKVGQ